MPFQPSLGTLRDALLFGTATVGAFFAALWLSLVFWTYRDLGRRSQDRLMRLLAALIVLLLGPLGVIIYLLLRPQSTLDEAYQHALEEEALLSEIEARSQCPGCGARTRPEWQLCPACATRLRRQCASCGQLLELPWRLCPYCASPVAARVENGAGSRESSAISSG
jgi:hypothetical protein